MQFRRSKPCVLLYYSIRTVSFGRHRSWVVMFLMRFLAHGHSLSKHWAWCSPWPRGYLLEKRSSYTVAVNTYLILSMFSIYRAHWFMSLAVWHIYCRGFLHNFVTIKVRLKFRLFSPLSHLYQLRNADYLRRQQQQASLLPLAAPLAVSFSGLKVCSHCIYPALLNLFVATHVVLADR
jgi:hypothetical protein